MTVDPAPLLQVRGINKSFGAVVALDGVDLDVLAGEVLGLVGDNGAGKSTLVKIISGVLPPDSGETRFNGAPLPFGDTAAVKDLGIETVYQDLALVDAFDVVANIFLGRELTRRGIPAGQVLDHRRMQTEARRLLAELNVHVPSLKTRVRYLSGGQRQAISVARAKRWGSRLVIMDEPTAALGVQESARVLDLVRSLTDHGIAVILISHNLQHVFSVVHRIAVLRRGRHVGTRLAERSSPEDIVRLITGAEGSQ